MEQKFKNIKQFIDFLKQNSDIVGILEYGRRNHEDMDKGGDYDLTIVTRHTISESIGGLHFHIASIPIDCMIKSIDDFMRDEPSSEFELVHLNCKILFDRDGITNRLLRHINCIWQPQTELTEREIGWFRFTFKHVIDKLQYRLHDDDLYSNYFMAASLDWFLECYAKINKLEAGKPKMQFQYIKDNEPLLYDYFIQFFSTSDVDEHFKLLKLCADYMAKDIGGLWKDDEIIFHLNTDSVSQSEKDAVMNFIFRTE